MLIDELWNFIVIPGFDKMPLKICLAFVIFSFFMLEMLYPMNGIISLHSLSSMPIKQHSNGLSKPIC